MPVGNGSGGLCQFILPSKCFHAQVKRHFTKYEVWNICDQNEGIWNEITKYERLGKKLRSTELRERF